MTPLSLGAVLGSTLHDPASSQRILSRIASTSSSCAECAIFRRDRARQNAFSSVRFASRTAECDGKPSRSDIGDGSRVYISCASMYSHIVNGERGLLRLAPRHSCRSGSLWCIESGAIIGLSCKRSRLWQELHPQYLWRRSRAAPERDWLGRGCLGKCQRLLYRWRRDLLVRVRFISREDPQIAVF